MILEELLKTGRTSPGEAAEGLTADDIKTLTGLLSNKDDNVRYPAFLILQKRLEVSADVWPYREVFRERLEDKNSFQRNIGLELIADNAKWDEDGWTAGILDEYFVLLRDEKPITVRKCVQGLKRIAAARPELHGRITEALTTLDLMEIRESMRKLVLCDILEVLAVIRKAGTDEEIEKYISEALSGGVLDKRLKKKAEEILE